MSLSELHRRVAELRKANGETDDLLAP